MKIFGRFHALIICSPYFSFSFQNGANATGAGIHGANGNVAAQYQSQTQTSSSSSSAYAATSRAAVNSASIPNAIPNPEGFGMYFPKAIPGGKDLWNHNPNPSHGGIAPLAGVYGPSSIGYEGKSNYNSSSSSSSSISASQSYGGFNATTNTGSLGEDSRPKYHIPGYSGHIRGERNRFGDTYGKQSRMSLDVPTDTPLEP